MKRWNRDMHKYDLNIIILGQIVHKNEVNYTFEIFNLYPTLKGTHLTLTLTLGKCILTKIHLRVKIKKNFQHQVKSPLVWTFLA